MGKSKKIKINKVKSLPEDLIISILVKLPVKPLMRFRCVCKSWYDLIKSPNFIEMHQSSTQNNKNECILIKRVRRDNVAELSFHSYESLNEFLPRLEVPHCHFQINKFDVSWPCNGLLLCIGYDDDYKRIVFLCNPATREFKLLPPCLFISSDLDIKIGLGFDSIRKDYKIVIIKDMKKPQIYNLSSDSCRYIENEMPKIGNSDVQGVPFNGALHWVAKRDKKNIVYSFDVSTEVFQDINLPQVLAHSDDLSGKILTLINDSLAMFTFTYAFSSQKFVDIWVMKEGSWMKQISFGGLVMFNELIIPCLLWKNDTILINILLSKKLKLWALDTHELIDTEISSFGYQYGVVIYKESLVFIK